MILQAHTISSTIVRQLNCDAVSGSVHSVFASTVNVLFGRSLYMSLHGPGIGMHPCAVRLDETPGLPSGPGLLDVTVGERVYADTAEIALRSGRLAVRLKDAGIWNPALEPLSADSSRVGAGCVEMIREAIEEGGPVSPFLRQARRTGSLQSAFSYECNRIKRDLALAWRHGDVAGATGAMRRAIGLGPGLTPSGDDFLVGFLGAAHAFARGDVLAQGVRQSLHVERSMTTLPSYFMIRGALAGFLPQALSDLLRAIAGTVPRRIRDSTRRLAELGAASGQDMLTGVICYLEAAGAAAENR